jgi:outer membrane protein assembly factor BamB
MTLKHGIKRQLTIAAILLLATSCRSGSERDRTIRDRTTADTALVKEAKNIMTIRYEQPYANPQLNSYVDAPVKASGRLAWKAAINSPGLQVGPQDLYVLDDRRALLDAGDVFFAIGLADRKELGFRRKSNNAFIALGPGTQFYFADGYQLIRQDFERYNQSAEAFFVPGLGQYSVLSALFAGPETFIAGVQGLGNPRVPTTSFELYEKPYRGTARRWSHGFDGMIVRPPIDPSGTAVVARRDTVTVVDRQGARQDIVMARFQPISCSIGPDGLLYLVGTTGAKVLLRACTLKGEMRWEVPAAIPELLQPPIVDADGVVYLVAPGNVTAFQAGKRLWEYPVSSPQPRATAFQDLRLVVADGARVVCLDESGRVLWSYEDKDGETFVTPPVLDPAGRVLVVSEKSIVVIE